MVCGRLLVDFFTGSAERRRCGIVDRVILLEGRAKMGAFSVR